MTNGTVSASYGYLANSPLFSTLTFKQSGTTRMTTTRQHDFLHRLVSISSVPSASGQPPVSITYQYDAANQRRRATLADGSYWAYDYDSLGQVTAGKRYWLEGTPVPGQQFEYGFDDIGNRTQAKSGGDQTGANLRAASYTNNVLNQITGRDVPAGFDVLGLAPPQATVKVNGSSADYRHEDYFQEALTVSNGSASVWQSVSVTATNSGASTTWPTGYVFVPKTPEVFAYDGDGNLTSDGRWTYTWDGENRLLSMVSLTNTPTESKRKLEFAYDNQGRRISKRVSCCTNSTWQVAVSNLFVYDRWNLIGELSATNRTLIRGYVWGLDLSGTMHGAGGVGGVLCEMPAGSSPEVVAYDGNGNVVALIDATNGSASGYYEYGPFGEVLRVSGSMAKGNPLLFSTKYQDDESGLLYYGHRYYSAAAGRWLSRDPVEEEHFVLPRWQAGAKHAGNMWTLDSSSSYAFVGNSPQTHVDFLGLACVDEVNKAWDSKPIRRLRDALNQANCADPDLRITCLCPPRTLGFYDAMTGDIFVCCPRPQIAIPLADTLKHELQHALDGCKGNLLDCEQIICSEIRSYYYVDCRGRIDKLRCAKEKMQYGMSPPHRCELQASALTDAEAKNCLKSPRLN